MTSQQFDIQFEDAVVIVTHRPEGHVFRFPIQSGGISFHGAHIRTIESAPHPGRYFLSQAMDAAKAAYAERKSASGRE